MKAHQNFYQKIVRLDKVITTYMDAWGIKSLQVSLGVIFIWFGLLKICGISPAENLVLDTVRWLPFLSSQEWFIVIGYWEVIIGLTFLFRKTIRIAIALLALQMVGTFLPLVILPEVTFQKEHFPYGLTMEGQYIIKNLLIISSALTVGGSLRRQSKR